MIIEPLSVKLVVDPTNFATFFVLILMDGSADHGAFKDAPNSAMDRNVSAGIEGPAPGIIASTE
jgi:hypothetical protein